MSEYRIKSSGEVKTQGKIRKLNPNTSLPKVWGANVFEALGIDPVLASPKPEASGEFKTVVRNGVEQDANGNWVYAWTERDMFSDYTDEDGTVHTKAEQEAAYTSRKTAEAASQVRSQRDSLLAETDWMTIKAADTGTAVEEAWATYRQALRDITSQEGFPNNVTFPEKPE